VEDVQLMESAARKDTPSRMYFSVLAKCIEKNMITWPDQCSLATWKKAKEQGERLFKAELGGSYEVFNQRPIPEAIVSYCVGDVQCLLILHNRFKLALSIHRETQPVIQSETLKRVASTHAPDY
jgi:exonuclease 3'-5' domain-containing protein 1